MDAEHSRKNADSGLPGTARRAAGGESAFEHIGEVTVKLCRDAKAFLSIVGETAAALGCAARRPGKIRWRETLYQMDACGSDAVPIVSMICFLMGLIIGVQSAIQIHKYGGGGDVYIADAVGYSIVKELGPLMVAMICTGRAGAAFAAEIGTMKAAEEIDAMVTMGLVPSRFLIVPKFIALVFVMPLLTIVGDIAGLAGGLFVAIVQLHLPFIVYYNRLTEILFPRHFGESLLKSLVFAATIAVVGCWRGLDAGRDAQGVGRATTSTVVTSIVLIVIADLLLTTLMNVWF